jgi:hypothetical protein
MGEMGRKNFVPHFALSFSLSRMTKLKESKNKKGILVCMGAGLP